MTRYQFPRFPGGKTKAVTFSYDDGSQYDLKLNEIINKYGIKCTFNICSGFMSKTGGEYYLSGDEIRTNILPHGHEIAVHGQYHKASGKTRRIEAIKDVLCCRLELEKEFGTIIRGMAYADSGISEFINGITYEDVKHYLCELDIAYARSADGDNNRFELPNDWHNWLPTAHHDNPNVDHWIEQFNSYDVNNLYMAQRTPKLFYLWGHSFEFDRNDNWDRLEEICQKLGGKEDVWYATNIEICDYINAYNRLIYSADGKSVYNPNSIEIWFETDKEAYSVKPNETIKII